MNGLAEARVSGAALRRAGALAALLLGAAGCAFTPQLTPVTITPGCYAVTGDSWPPEVVRATGLRGLPSFVGLDTAVAGPGGRRVIVPTAWATSGARRRHAYWTEELHGNRQASLVLTLAGPLGEFVASLEASRDGYEGAGAVRARPGAAALPQVRITLLAVSCSGLRLQEAEQTP